MADDTVLIAIKAIDDASAALNKVASSLGALDTKITGTQDAFKSSDTASNDFTRAITETGTAADNAGKRFMAFHLTLADVQSGVMLAQEAIGKLKQVWDFAKEGAAIERINAQFNNMAANVGVDADNLVKALDKAAHGTVDDEELMQTATRALALGLTTNTKDLVGLMEVARASSVAFGGDTATAFERISTAVENLTPRALKQAGIIVDLKSAYEAYAKAQGKIPDQLTDEEKRQALLNQVLEKGKDLIDKVGRSGDDAATKFARLEAKMKDAGDQLHVMVADGLIPLLDNQLEFNKIFDQSADITERVKAIDYTLAHDVWPWEVKQLQELRDAILGVARAKREWGIQAIQDAAAKAIGPLAQGIHNIALANREAVSSGQDLINYINAEQEGMKRAADASQALADKNMALLKIGVAGQLANESKSFAQSQADLEKRLKATGDELADLEKKQGAVSKTTVKHQMSDAELALAQIKLAQTAQELNKALNPVDTAHKNIAKSATAAAAAQKKLAAETDPLKAAALSAEMAIQKEKIDGANQSVNTYVDNSKRIAELKQTYADLTAEIDASRKAHDEANKRILFDYAQQAIAQENARNGITVMSKSQTDALNALAVTWGIKSQADVDAMNQMLLAAKKLAQDNSLDEFGAIAQGALEGPKKPTDDLIKMMQGMQKEAADKMPKVATSISKIKPPAKEAFDQMAKLQIQTMTSGTAMQNTTQYGVIPMIKAMDLLAISLGTVNTQLGKLPTSLPPTNLPMPTPIAPSTPPVRTYPLTGGAQKGANYIVPPGYPNDTYYQRVSSGEHVQVTPQGKSGASGLNISKVEINVGGTNATIPQIQQAVWTEMTRVIEAASR